MILTRFGFTLKETEMNNLNHYQMEMRQIAKDAGKRKGVGGSLVAWVMMCKSQNLI